MSHANKQLPATNNRRACSKKFLHDSGTGSRASWYFVFLNSNFRCCQRSITKRLFLAMALEISEVRTGPSIRKMLMFFSCCGSSQNGWVVEPSQFEPPASPRARDNNDLSASDKAKSESLQQEIRSWSKSEDRDEDHQFYCPICMFFFKEIFKSRCCSHHICQECHIGIVQRKRKDSGLIYAGSS